VYCINPGDVRRCQSGGGGNGELRGEGAQGGEESGIHSTRVVEECTHNSLGAINLLRGQCRVFIWERGILNVLAIRWGCIGVRGILRICGHGVMVLVQCIIDIAWHGKVKLSVFIVPF
jgi:hypothetical protein